MKQFKYRIVYIFILYLNIGYIKRLGSKGFVKISIKKLSHCYQIVSNFVVKNNLRSFLISLQDY